MDTKKQLDSIKREIECRRERYNKCKEKSAIIREQLKKEIDMLHEKEFEFNALLEAQEWWPPMPCSYCGTIPDRFTRNSVLENPTNIECGKCGCRGPASFDGADVAVMLWDDLHYGHGKNKGWAKYDMAMKKVCEKQLLKPITGDTVRHIVVQLDDILIMGKEAGFLSCLYTSKVDIVDNTKIDVWFVCPGGTMIRRPMWHDNDR